MHTYYIDTETDQYVHSNHVINCDYNIFILVSARNTRGWRVWSERRGIRRATNDVCGEADDKCIAKESLLTFPSLLRLHYFKSTYFLLLSPFANIFCALVIWCRTNKDLISLPTVYSWFYFCISSSCLPCFCVIIKIHSIYKALYKNWK